MKKLILTLFLLLIIFSFLSGNGLQPVVDRTDPIDDVPASLS
ncbi:hypothetical protein [Sporolactobacillus sp. THM19-2]|nr:hypothetical protein [Sporolactobacillus sp. THM19-2]